ncbi:hypothetical protein M0R72_19155 [Candidatus Pacearchaeota archaeon]|jgi:hypothetical protein|nr:hypothetical protein [Candidatus Pacearchaeota archaeon]
MTESPVNLDEAKRLASLRKEDDICYNSLAEEYGKAIDELVTSRERIAELEGRAKFYQEHNFVNATPDGGYALRILQSYRSMCNCSWSDVLGGDPTNPLCIEMNTVNEKRKIELDEATAKLSTGIVPQAEDARYINAIIKFLSSENEGEWDDALEFLLRYLAAIEGDKP